MSKFRIVTDGKKFWVQIKGWFMWNDEMKEESFGHSVEWFSVKFDQFDQALAHCKKLMDEDKEVLRVVWEGKSA